MQIRNAFEIKEGLQVFSNKQTQKFITSSVCFPTTLNTIDLSIVLYAIICSSSAFETFLMMTCKFTKGT